MSRQMQESGSKASQQSQSFKHDGRVAFSTFRDMTGGVGRAAFSMFRDVTGGVGRAAFSMFRDMTGGVGGHITIGGAGSLSGTVSVSLGAGGPTSSIS